MDPRSGALTLGCLFLCFLATAVAAKEVALPAAFHLGGRDPARGPLVGRLTLAPDGQAGLELLFLRTGERTSFGGTLAHAGPALSGSLATARGLAGALASSGGAPLLVELRLDGERVTGRMGDAAVAGSTPFAGEGDPLSARYRLVRANGLELACVEAGSGPLVLLLHGFPDTPGTFDGLIPPLVAAGYRVVAPCMRGYHPSEAPAGDAYDPLTLGRDALGLIDALGESRAILIGHDWGAYAAYAAAALAPERVARLVTLAIPHPATFSPHYAGPLRAWRLRHFVTYRFAGAAARLERDRLAGVDAIVRRWSPTWSFGPEETAPVKRALSAPGGASAALGYYRALPLLGLPAALTANTRVPTLTLAGRDDGAADAKVFEAARRHFAAHHELRFVAGAGHFLHRERPDEVAGLILAFLRGDERSLPIGGGVRGSVRESIVIRAPIERVFALISDHEGTPGWAGVKEVELIRAGTHETNGLGALRRVTFPQLLAPVLEEEVTHFDAPHGYRYAIRKGFPGLQSHEGRWILEDLGGGRTHVRWDIDFEFSRSHPFRLVAGPFERWFRGVVAKSLVDLRAKLE